MGRYFLLRCRQLVRVLVWVLAAAVLLSLGAAAAGTALVRQEEEGAAQQKYRVALCGIADDPLFQLGVTALKSLDETRYSVELLTMEEPEALQALENETLDAYVQIPEGFLESALGGNVPTLRYVTAPGGTAVGKLFESEITGVIGSILLTAQKGSYGAYYAMHDNGMEDRALTALNELCLEYVELALDRADAYEVQMLGIGSGLELADYLTCGFAVVLSCLLCLSFAPMLVQREIAMGRMLAGRGCSAAAQAWVDFGCMLLGMAATVSAVFWLMAAAGISVCLEWSCMLPVVYLTAAMGFFWCSVTRDVISGVMLQFLAAVAMCFVSGCLYPVYFLPVLLQRLALWLPTGLCREYLAGCVTGRDHAMQLGGMLLWTVGFAVIAVCIRRGRVVHTKGAA